MASLFSASFSICRRKAFFTMLSNFMFQSPIASKTIMGAKRISFMVFSPNVWLLHTLLLSDITEESLSKLGRINRYYKKKEGLAPMQTP
jgi:hypothetical protein